MSSSPDPLATWTDVARAERGAVQPPSGPGLDEAVAPEVSDPAAPDVPPPTPSPPKADKPEPKRTPVQPKPQPLPVPVPEKTPEPVEAAPPPAPPEVDVAAGARRVDELAAGGREQDARREAEALLAAHGSFSGLTTALGEGATDEVAVRLSALRVLQLAGFEAEATELARELKRSHMGTPEVLESIRRWRLLTPRISGLDSSVEDGSRLVVTGNVENPDIGEIRRVRVRVDALDAAGNVLTSIDARVRPKRLDSGDRGSFSVRFDGVEPGSILKTRATVVEWESEVLEGG